MRAADAQKDKDMRSCLQADGERGQSHSPVSSAKLHTHSTSVYVQICFYNIFREELVEK